MPPQHLETVHPRHCQVADDNVERLPLQLFSAQIRTQAPIVAPVTARAVAAMSRFSSVVVHERMRLPARFGRSRLGRTTTEGIHANQPGQG